MPPLLTATAITKTFTQGDSANRVLNEVSLQVHAGEFVAVMGPSGSGKSTLLYCLSGMDTFDSGSVTIGGTDVGALSEDERARLRGERLGFVFQDANLIDALNVLDNILLVGSLAGDAPTEDLVARAHQLMRITGIAGLDDRGVNEISGGQRQRVSLCRALLHRPDILFGDEPTGALNASTSAEIVALLKTINQDGMTLLVVTHDAGVAAAASRVVFLADGAVMEQLDLDPNTTTSDRERAVITAMTRLEV